MDFQVKFEDGQGFLFVELGLNILCHLLGKLELSSWKKTH